MGYIYMGYIYVWIIDIYKPRILSAMHSDLWSILFTLAQAETKTPSAAPPLEDCPVSCMAGKSANSSIYRWENDVLVGGFYG